MDEDQICRFVDSVDHRESVTAHLITSDAFRAETPTRPSCNRLGLFGIAFGRIELLPDHCLIC